MPLEGDLGRRFASGSDLVLGGFVFLSLSLSSRGGFVSSFFSFAFGLLVTAVVSCLRLVVRVRHTTTTLLN